MAQRSADHPAVLFVFLMAVDIFGMAGVAAIQAGRQHLAQRYIKQKPAQNSGRHLADEQRRDHAPEFRRSGQQRDSLIAGSQKNGQQRSRRNDPACVKVRGQRRKTALRHTAQQRTGHKAPAPAPGQCPFNPGAMVAFKPFDQQICKKKEGQHGKAVLHGVFK